MVSNEKSDQLVIDITKRFEIPTVLKLSHGLNESWTVLKPAELFKAGQTILKPKAQRWTPMAQNGSTPDHFKSHPYSSECFKAILAQHQTVLKPSLLVIRLF